MGGAQGRCAARRGRGERAGRRGGGAPVSGRVSVQRRTPVSGEPGSRPATARPSRAVAAIPATPVPALRGCLRAPAPHTQKLCGLRAPSAFPGVRAWPQVRSSEAERGGAGPSGCCPGACRGHLRLPDVQASPTTDHTDNNRPLLATRKCEISQVALMVFLVDSSVDIRGHFWGKRLQPGTDPPGADSEIKQDSR
nr:uncharacterized protein LOC115849603 isoform X2 [Globicephala melas]